MTVQAKILQLEKQLEKKFPVEKPTEKPILMLYLDLISNDIPEGFGIKANPPVIPESMKVRHIDWEFFYEFTVRRKNEFSEKTYREQIDFCNEIKDVFDTIGAWKD